MSALKAGNKPNNLLLVVDDEPDIVQAYVDFLTLGAAAPARKSSRSLAPPASEGAGEQTQSGAEYEILRAHSGEEALQLLKNAFQAGKRVAGGFFDVKMEGGMDGLRTIQEIWKVDPAVNCVIVTAYQDRSVQDINSLFGDRFKDQWDYLNKPFTSGEIIQKARQMTAAWNRRKGLEDALNDLKEAELQLVQSERMSAIGQVARGVGHEFGNILQRIVGKADLSLSETDIAKIKENLAVILRAADNASVITRNLQSFSRESSERKPVNLVQVVTDTLALTSHDLKKAGVEVRCGKAEGMIVEGCAPELQQVVLNLVINAMHAMPKGGELAIHFHADAKDVQLSIADTGTGIPPDVLPRIFDYAFTTKGEKGSGLGLSISRNIIEAHGGSIVAESVAGKGATFKITLPRLDRG